ncbi:MULTISPECIES: ABC transporter ATP-binding protein [unclassified Clostridium]|uniref:ABC transporter ATP-binding protein n=1 Tax=unclassified Clostridium TaxID=2614128 RepID=UPI001899382C|nr:MULTISPECIES: ABC transporter ATP-binding protein [unclassified Clostridium]
MENNQILELIDLKKSFGEKQVLKGIDLKINKGTIIGYIGPNGAGKSTTVKLIMGLVTGYTGEIRIFGEDISNGDESYKRKLGYVPEVPEIYDSLTGKEYLTFIAQLYEMDYDKADDKARKLMDILGIADVYEKRISSYSKGMKQKLILISSLLHNPEILFLDEPLSGLDANSVMIIKEILSYLAKEGKTIFYSSHIMEVVEKISDRIILINNGEIVADGNFEELKSNYKESSLESIFNEVTGFHQYKELAENFISVVKEV